MAKHETNINIYGGNVQVMPNVREVEQHIHTDGGNITIINKYKNVNSRIHKSCFTDSRTQEVAMEYPGKTIDSIIVQMESGRKEIKNAH